MCERDGDVIGCEQGLAFVGPQFAARALAPPGWQLGARLGLGFQPSGRGTASQAGIGPVILSEERRRLYELTLSGRFQPSAVDGYWLGASLGGALLQVLTTTQGVTRLTGNHWAPVVEGEAGYDFLLGQNTALCLGAHVSGLFFTQDSGFDTESDSTTYGPVFGGGISLGVNIGF